MAALTDEQKQIATALIIRLQDDDIQQRLRAGFEREFSNSVLEQWNDRVWLSFEGRNGKRSQVEIIRDIIAQCEQRGAVRSSSSGGASRRYEGFHGSRD